MHLESALPAPYLDRVADVPSESLPARDVHPSAAGILVAEDDDAVREVLGRWFSVQGYRAWMTRDGDEAVQVYHRHQARIDLVLLDVCMPGRDGPQTLAALRAVNPAVRVVFMSGYLGAYEMEQLLGLGACGFLAKPFRLEHVA